MTEGLVSELLTYDDPQGRLQLEHPDGPDLSSRKRELLTYDGPQGLLQLEDPDGTSFGGESTRHRHHTQTSKTPSTRRLERRGEGGLSVAMERLGREGLLVVFRSGLTTLG